MLKHTIINSKLKYREEIEEFARERQGELSSLDRQILEALRVGLGLLPEEAAAIQQEVLQPYQERKKKLQQYKQALVQAFRREYPLGEDTRNGLQRLQEVLGLEEEDTANIEAKIVQKRNDSVWTANLALAIIAISLAILAGICSWAAVSLLFKERYNQPSPQPSVSSSFKQVLPKEVARTPLPFKDVDESSPTASS
ncbi:MAG TPA: hypothetical protein V6D12_15235 [Candidatus Obscuribacterales bacterium]